MRKFLFALILLGVSIILANLLLFPKKPIKHIKVGRHSFLVEVARTPQEQERGLSGRKNLAHETGLYFLFDEAKTQSIWMKDMNFAIDVLWMREGRVVEITENISPLGGGQPIVISREPVDAFIEVNSGFVKKNNLKLSDRVDFF